MAMAEQQTVSFDQVDFGEPPPPPPQLVLGWNTKRRRRKCSQCDARKTFPVRAVFWNADDAFKFVCPACAKPLVPGLFALWEFTPIIVEKSLPPDDVLSDIGLRITNYRYAVGL